MDSTPSCGSQAPLLLERELPLERLRGSLAAAVAGSGTLLLVAGEPGVGKTSLVRSFADQAGFPVRWGACDPLSTPVPLGPFHDLAQAAGSALTRVLAAGCSPHDVFAAVRGELDRAPSILVIEDIHWADGASLDVLRLLGRRVTSLPVLIVATYRETLPGTVDPLRVALGDLAGAPGVSRITVEPFSSAAVGVMAAGHAIDGAELFRRTSGNPFYVSQVLEGGGASVPATVRDAVLARAARLDPAARRVLDAISVMPLGAEPWLLEAVADDGAAGTLACLGAGMLTSAGHTIAFRHEIAREAVELALPASDRLRLHRSILAALTGASVAVDPARLAHHAELACDGAAVRSFALEAATRARSLGAHRQAAAQYARVLRSGGELPEDVRADLLEARADALYESDDQLGSIADLEAARALHERLGNVPRQADAMRRLASPLLCQGRFAEARDAATGSVALLEGLPVGREAGRSLAALALFWLAADDLDAALEVGGQALAIASELGDDEAVTEIAITVATAESLRDGPAGARALEQALGRARARRSDGQVLRALHNLALLAVVHRSHAHAAHWIARGLAEAARPDLDLWRYAIQAIQLRSELDQGHWTAASELAETLVEQSIGSPAPRVEGLLVRALVRARRGDPGAEQALSEAHASVGGDLILQVVAATATAEIAWLAGRSSEIAEATGAAWEIALQQSSRSRGELALWRHRAGLDVECDRAMPVPIELELQGRHADAAAAWDELESPYEAALALSLADDAALIAAAHGRLQLLGAGAAAAMAARRLRARGVRGIRRGPQRATRRNPAQLTPRELDVLALVTDGLSNAEISHRLFVSTRTVDHHVSAILRKLEVPTRGRAIAAAAASGIVPTRVNR